MGDPKSVEQQKEIFTRALEKLDPNIKIGNASAIGRIFLIVLVLAIWLLTYVLLGLAPKKYNFTYTTDAYVVIIIGAILQFAGFVLLTMSDILFTKSAGLAKLGGVALVLVTIGLQIYMIDQSVNKNEVYDKPYVNIGLASSITLSLAAIIFSFYL